LGLVEEPAEGEHFLILHIKTSIKWNTTILSRRLQQMRHKKSEAFALNRMNPSFLEVL
jgi:hypothetical protein